MGNPHKGEVEFTVGEKTYTLYFSINALCELEEALGGNVVELATLMADASKLSIKNVRTIFWAGLRDHHEAMSLTDAGRLMSDMGIAEAMELVAKAFTLSFPDTGGEAKRPLRSNSSARVSTGKGH